MRHKRLLCCLVKYLEENGESYATDIKSYAKKHDYGAFDRCVQTLLNNKNLFIKTGDDKVPGTCVSKYKLNPDYFEYYMDRVHITYSPGSDLKCTSMYSWKRSIANDLLLGILKKFGGTCDTKSVLISECIKSHPFVCETTLKSALKLLIDSGEIECTVGSRRRHNLRLVGGLR